MRKGSGLFVGLALLLIGLGWALPATQAASSFALPAFKQQWEAGEAITPNFWGPLANATEAKQEPYKEATDGQRTVQYFDKGRMETTRGAITNGLLATEIVTGRIQRGDATFEQRAPPAIPIAGDPDTIGATYAALATKGQQLLAPATDTTNSGAASLALSASGEVIVNPKSGSQPPAYAFTLYDDTTKHNVARAFADYRARVGLGAIGYAISEPFVAMVKVAGTQRTVLIEVFERRVLTYTADNPAAFQVEMGNIGQHYYQWRYGPGGATLPSATPLQSATATATATTPPTNPSATAAPIRPGVAPTNAASCPIIYPVKGVTQSGTKTYDIPGSPTYFGAKPEICFISPADADAAGYHVKKP
ncbi:MAG: hypothetical protein M3176_13100 [Chloroflexota bacterium]|nr:hypothetical protein [Chloroflexota bacterium]